MLWRIFKTIKSSSVATVYKYTKPLNDNIQYDLPEGARILRIDVQKEQGSNTDICLWALVNPQTKTFTSRFIRIAGTGHPIQTDDWLGYINTFTMADKALWFHAFEIIQ